MIARSSLSRGRFAVALAAAVSLAVGPLSGPAGAGTLTARGSGLVARFTYAGKYPAVRDLRLSVTRAGTRVYDAPVHSSYCGSACTPLGLRVVHLRRDAPAVLLSLYTGGAHCCYVDQVLERAAGGTYRTSEHNFGDPGARLRLLPGYAYPQFVTADDAFAYAFTDYAASGLPVRILRFEADAFVNVTRRYPKLIRADAALWMRAFRAQAAQHYPDSTGLIAAWAADEVELGRLHYVTTLLAREAAAGHLHSGLSPLTPSGGRFVTQLMRFLRRHHYFSG